MIRLLAAASISALLLGAPALAQDALAPTAGGEVAAPEDLAKTCEALSAEAVQLNTQMGASAADAPKPSVVAAVGKRAVGNVAGNVTQRVGLNALGRMGGHLGSFGALAAVAANHAAAVAVSDKIANAGTSSGPAAPTAAQAGQSDRMHLLMVAYKQKGCQ